MTERCGNQDQKTYEMEESFWRMDPCGTQADTYIEWRFEFLCRNSETGMHILDEWHARKGEYVARIGTIVYDFQHFSRHDASHSINILEAIEMLLGRERINKLSRGDLWLLLECAYFHDIGMSMTHEEIVDLWENDRDFQKYVRERLTGYDNDEKYAANLYYQIENLIHDKQQMETLQKEDEIDLKKIPAWMVQAQNALLLLTTGYKRRNHAEEALRHFDANRESYIPARLYRVVAEVSRMHGENHYENIMTELKYCTKGVGSMALHPQFAAAMLRIGDLLDMDNNRFDPYTMEHFGRFPALSTLHYKKHHALTHLAIRPEKIEAEAISDEYDVCRVTNDWFRMLKSEVDHLICYWNVMAPESLKGCLLEPGSYEVYYKDRKTPFSEHPEMDFKVNKDQFIKLVVGSNIYDGDFEFYREYLQNALDASKMKLWLELKQGTYAQKVNEEIGDIRELSPMDIDRSVFERYEIEVSVDLDLSSQLVELAITDHGIGMDRECVEAIATIGSGWKKRKKYAVELSDMPDWLRPTGGFGIGIQSAFMVTDEVTITTRGEDEKTGRKLTIRNAGQNERGIMEETCPLRWTGSVISMKIPLSCFQNWNYMRTEPSKSDIVYSIMPFSKTTGSSQQPDFFDREATLNYVMSLLEMLTNNLLVDSPIPVRITNPSRTSISCCEVYLPKASYWEEEQYYKGTEETYRTGVLEYNGDKYQYVYDNPDKDSYIYIWMRERNILAAFRLSDKKEIPARIKLGFKNVVVKKAVESRKIPAPYESLEGCIDFLGGKAEATVQINRNDFVEGFEFQQVYEELLYVFIYALRDRYHAFLNEMIEDSINLEKNYVYTMIGKLMLDTDQWVEEITGQMNAFKGEYTEPEGIPALKMQKHTVEGKSFLAKIDIEEPMYAMVPDNYTLYEKSFPIESLMPRKEHTKAVLREFGEAEFIITDGQIYELLVLSAKYERRGYRLLNKNYVLVRFTRAQEKSVVTVDEEQFYTKIYEDAQNRGRVFRENPGIHEKLLVERLPYGIRERSEAEKTYLISPLTNSCREEIEKLLSYGTKITWERFFHIITEKDDYKALLKWVTERQINNPKLETSDIEKEYDQFLQKIYQYNFPPL
ncbi:MAG: ATP-binding protein [Clostridiales bacterium]|nr:ATP-binding protein [Clostridiales bacterium]